MSGIGERQSQHHLQVSSIPAIQATGFLPDSSAGVEAQTGMI
jgi:hypothetical protein